MRVLLDENLPHKLRGLLTGHEVVTVAYLKWVGIKNGELLTAAEEAGFEVLVTSDHGIPYEQNMAGRKLAMVMLSTPDWNHIRTEFLNILDAVNACPAARLRTVQRRFSLGPDSNHQNLRRSDLRRQPSHMSCPGRPFIV